MVAPQNECRKQKAEGRKKSLSFCILHFAFCILLLAGCRRDKPPIDAVQRLAYSVKPSVVRVRSYATAEFSYPSSAILAVRGALRADGLTVEAKDLPGQELQMETGSGGSGSGFIIHPDGTILTSGHVVAPTRDLAALREELLRNGAIAALVRHFRIDVLRTLYRNDELERYIAMIVPQARLGPAKIVNEVELSNGQAYPYVVHAFSPSLMSRGSDLAVLKIGRRNLPAMRLGDSDSVHLGEQVWAVGYPAVASSTDEVIGGWLSRDSDLEATFNNGTITSIKRDVTRAPVFQTNLAIYQGNSGGPAVNEQGEAIGIATWGHTTADQIKFLVPIDLAKDLLGKKRIPFNVDGAFNREFSSALEAASSGDWQKAREGAVAANAIFPDSPDVIRFRLDVERALRRGGGWTSSQPSTAQWILLSIVMAAAVSTVTVAMIRRRPVLAAAGAGGPAVMVSPGSRSRDDTGSRRGDRSMIGRFTILNGDRAGEKLGLGGSGIRIGRESSVCEIVLENPKISRLHAEVVTLDGKVLLIDRNSSNGTFVNDRKIDRYFLHDGDIIHFGGRSAVAVAFNQ